MASCGSLLKAGCTGPSCNSRGPALVGPAAQRKRFGAVAEHAGPRVAAGVARASGVDEELEQEALPLMLEVDEVLGCRLEFDEQQTPVIEYMVSWKGDYPETWEPTNNLSADLLRDYDEKWWTAVKKGDLETMKSMLAYSGELLVLAVDTSRRSALHFAAALGNVEMAQLLLETGADPVQQDDEGYTPLHMAVGYMRIPTVMALLDKGADPEVKDNNSRDVVGLIASLRDNLPPEEASKLGPRLQLEEVAAKVQDMLYEDLPPAQILDRREMDDGTSQYLVQWPDSEDDDWVSEDMVSDEVKADYAKGIEYGVASGILDERAKGMSKEYLVSWADQQPPTWVLEDDLPPGMAETFLSSRSGNGNGAGSPSTEAGSSGSSSGSSSSSSSQQDPALVPV